MPVGRAVSALEIQSLDQYAIEVLGIPSLTLMENAGRAVSAEILRRLNRLKRPFVVIFCGLGHNAGDGFVVARHLQLAGIRVVTYIIGKADHLKSDAAANYRRLKKINGRTRSIQAAGRDVCRDISDCDMVVDAIFGVGLNRKVKNPFLGIIKAINRHAKNVLSIDVPSGLDSTTGKIHGACVKADKTVTFTYPKKGFYLNSGPRYTGKICVADIGIPRRLISKIKIHD